MSGKSFLGIFDFSEKLKKLVSKISAQFFSTVYTILGNIP
jgi:hypothetical protein